MCVHDRPDGRPVPESLGALRALAVQRNTRMRGNSSLCVELPDTRARQLCVAARLHRRSASGYRVAAVSEKSAIEWTEAGSKKSSPS